MLDLSLTDDLQRPYTSAGMRYGEIYALARALVERLSAAGDGPVCLASQDRALIAASLLAAGAGGPRLVLPHGLTEPVLAEARALTGFERVLGAEAEALPPGTHLVSTPTVAAGTPPPVWKRPADEPFVALFTGGSTGRPRIWDKTPANLLVEARDQSARLGIGPDDVVLSSVGPLHIYGLLFTVLAPLLAGARVVDRTAFLPAEIAELFDTCEPSVFVSGPAHYRALRDTPLSASRLRIALSSGGMLDADDAARFFQHTGIGVTEVYGSTETGGIATRCRAAGQTDWTPLAGVRWALRAERLAVDSAYLSPDLTRAADGLFVTGDRVEATEADRFALLGRADGIVKVAGKRVDLLEVEQRLRALPGVSDAHVLAVDSPGRGREIVALLVCDRNEAALREALSHRLEPAALPRRMLRLTEIPTLPSGKRDGRAIDHLLAADVCQPNP